MKLLLFAPMAALLLAFPASANASPIQTLTLRQSQTSERGLQDIFEVHERRSPGGVIVRDALYGGLAGLAIGGGVALLQNDGNWGRDLAVGAGIGLLVGGIFGAVDAASMADRGGPMRDVGFSRAVSPISGKF